MIDKEREQELLRERALGWGLACEEVAPGVDLGRDIALIEGPGGLDFALLKPIDTQFLVHLPRREGEPITMACKVRHCQQIAQKLYSVGACFIRQVTRSQPRVPAATSPAAATAIQSPAK